MTTRANLAGACVAAGRLKEAIGQAKRVLDDRERVLGHDHPDTLGAVGSLAATYHSARRLKDALPLFERAFRDRERVQGPDHPDTLGAQGNLASAYHSAGRMASALPLYERSQIPGQNGDGGGVPGSAGTCERTGAVNPGTRLGSQDGPGTSRRGRWPWRKPCSSPSGPTPAAPMGHAGG